MKIRLIQISFLFTIVYLFQACYSFTGGSIPSHLKTLYISAVNDNSGFGNPEYRDLLTNNLIDVFRTDNSLSQVDFGGDARLTVIISAIRESPVTVSPGELETERKVEVHCDVEYYDNVKKSVIFKKNFMTYDIYPVSDAITGRTQAITTALNQVADDILLAVVSGW
ncbi:MAG: LptE family protein [Candidatus Kapabacteria bacterium]|nr:LptE family protein [Candidatus Kapabacteria bacterium]